jgi:hypothetical protein
MMWRGLGENREVPPPAILGLRAHLRGELAEACLEEEGGARGKHGFPRESELKASDHRPPKRRRRLAYAANACSSSAWPKSGQSVSTNASSE